MYHFEELKPRRKREMLSFMILLALVVATLATVMAENVCAVCARKRERLRDRAVWFLSYLSWNR
jgi:hypothetical protein